MSGGRRLERGRLLFCSAENRRARVFKTRRNKQRTFQDCHKARKLVCAALF